MRKGGGECSSADGVHHRVCGVYEFGRQGVGVRARVARLGGASLRTRWAYAMDGTAHQDSFGG